MFAAIATMPDRPPLTAGLTTTFHVEPFQCSTSGKLPVPLLYEPTAQTLFAETAATPFRELKLVLAFGLETVLHPDELQALRIGCGRVAADAPTHLDRNKDASARTMTQGKMV